MGNIATSVEVESETDPEKWYQVFANGTVIKCTCKGYLSHRTCKHLGAVQAYIQQTEGGIEEEDPADCAVPTRPLASGSRKSTARISSNMPGSWPWPMSRV